MWLKTKRSTYISVYLRVDLEENKWKNVSVFFCLNSYQSLFKCLSVTRRRALIPPHVPVSAPPLVFPPQTDLEALPFLAFSWCYAVKVQWAPVIFIYLFFLSLPLLRPVLIDACLIRCFASGWEFFSHFKSLWPFGVHTHSKKKKE